MKKAIIIIVCVLGFLSCNNHCKEDTEFKRIYFSMLDTVASFGKQYNADEEFVIVEERVSRFSNYADYLQFLTEHKLRYTFFEFPIYQNQSDLEADIRDLKKWYDENKCGMTIQKADSIVNASFEQITGQKDSMWWNTPLIRELKGQRNE